MLMKNKGEFIRVLDDKDDQKLIINCKHPSMPTWVKDTALSEYASCAEEELPEKPSCYEELSPQQQRIAHERYTLIAGVLPFLGDKQLRCEVIARMAAAKNISKQTIRHYLQRYLVYQNIAALAPPPKQPRGELI